MKKSKKPLELKRETLLQLKDSELAPAAGAAPTNGANCTISDPSACVTCLCTR